MVPLILFSTTLISLIHSASHTHTARTQGMIVFSITRIPSRGQIGQLPKRDMLERRLSRFKRKPIALLTLPQMWQ